MEQNRAEDERQRQQRERQLAVERERTRQIQSQVEQTRRERERIVSKGQALAENYRQTTDTINRSFDQIKDVFQRQMEEKRRERQAREEREAEREAREEQRRLDRQLADLEEKLKAQQERAAEIPDEAPASGRLASNDNSFRLPPPVELYEPAGEEQLARGQTRILSPSQAREAETEQHLAMMREKATGRSILDIDPAQSGPPQNRVFPSLAELANFENATESETGKRHPMSALFEHTAERVQEAGKAVGEFLQPLRESIKSDYQVLKDFGNSEWFNDYFRDLFYDYLENEEVRPVQIGLQKAASDLWDKTLAEKMARSRYGKSYDDLEIDQQMDVDLETRIAPGAVTRGPHPIDRGRYIQEIKKELTDRLEQALGPLSNSENK
jgi:uncharacterized protein YoxC